MTTVRDYLESAKECLDKARDLRPISNEIRAENEMLSAMDDVEAEINNAIKMLKDIEASL